MAARTGVVLKAARGGEIGYVDVGLGYFDLSTVTLANTDVITWSKILPNGGCRVLAVHLSFREIDVHATAPTGIFTAGNTDDADGYITTGNLGIIPAQAPAGSAETGLPLQFHGDGALVAGSTGYGKITNRDITMTVTAAIATVATSGLINLRVWTEGVL